MKIEDLERKILQGFVRKYHKDELDSVKSYFVLQLRGTYHEKEIRFSDTVKSDLPVIEIKAESYEECFKSLLEILEYD